MIALLKSAVVFLGSVLSNGRNDFSIGIELPSTSFVSFFHHTRMCLCRRRLQILQRRSVCFFSVMKCTEFCPFKRGNDVFTLGNVGSVIFSWSEIFVSSVELIGS